MPVVVCPKCSTNLKIPDGASGNVKCPKCGAIFPTAAKPSAPALPLLTSVLYSADRGVTWTDQAFEQTITELEVKLDQKTSEHLVKVVATDGTRSAEAIIRLLVQAPPPPPKKK